MRTNGSKKGTFLCTCVFVPPFVPPRILEDGTPPPTEWSMSSGNKGTYLELLKYSPGKVTPCRRNGKQGRQVRTVGRSRLLQTPRLGNGHAGHWCSGVDVVPGTGLAWHLETGDRRYLSVFLPSFFLPPLHSRSLAVSQSVSWQSQYSFPSPAGPSAFCPVRRYAGTCSRFGSISRVGC